MLGKRQRPFPVVFATVLVRRRLEGAEQQTSPPRCQARHEAKDGQFSQQQGSGGPQGVGNLYHTTPPARRRVGDLSRLNRHPKSNLSERSVRPIAIGRKNYLFMGSDNGGKAAAVLYSIMASAKANQVEPSACVRDLLNQLSRHSPPEAATPLPDAWLAAHPETRWCWSR